MSFSNHESYNQFSRQEQFPYQDPNAANTVLGEKKRGCGCWLLGCGIGCLGLILLAVLTGVVVYYVCLKGHPLEVSPETTVITEPKKTDGQKVDFFKAIQNIAEPKIPDNDNGFTDVLTGYGSALFESKQSKQISELRQYTAMCERFHLDPLAVPKFVLIDFIPDDVNHWLTVTGPGLDAAVTAAMKPNYFIPMIRHDENDLALTVVPDKIFDFHGKLAEALRQRARHRFASGDFAGGWKDYLATLRLFRRITINNALLETLNNGKIESKMLLQMSDFDAEKVVAKMPAELRGQAVKDLETLPDWQDRKVTLKTLQFGVLDILSATDDMPKLFEKFSDQPIPAAMKQLAEVIGFDWNLTAKKLNEQFKLYEEKLNAAGSGLAEQSNDLPPMNGTSVQDSFKRLTDEMKESGTAVTVAGRSDLAGSLAGQIFTQIAGQMFKIQHEEEQRCKDLKKMLQE
ncbi:MAG: hypothetical protein LBT46_04585 [Planctomycetaceae bacterium]|jgi:hypothetical protein|nr:hypothetical protein [Planctomycetaceae bacterium]